MQPAGSLPCSQQRSTVFILVQETSSRENATTWYSITPPPTFSATIVIVIATVLLLLLIIIIIIMHKVGVRLYNCTLIPYIRSASQQPSRCPEHCSCHGMSRCMQTSGAIELLLLRMTVTNDAACRRTFTCIGIAYVHCPN